MSKRKEMYFLFGVVLLIIAFFLSFFFRPFVYRNNINDFGFVDIIGSLFSVITFCFIVWGLKDYTNAHQNKHILLATFVYSFIWEFMGYFGFYGTYDFKDILAGIFSGILTYILKNFINKKYPI